MRELVGLAHPEMRHPPRNEPRGFESNGHITVAEKPNGSLVDKLVQNERAQEVLKVLEKWDLGVVIRYAVQEGIYKSSEIADVASEYRKYMALAITFHADIPISERLDPFWHTHILFTQDYTAMCMTAAGHYIHHRPRILDDEAGLVRDFKYATLGLYREVFGEPNPSFWNSTLCRCGPDD